MTAMDLIYASCYYQRINNSIMQINYNSKVFFDKFQRADSLFGLKIIKKYFANEIIIAYNFIKDNKVENIAIDYMAQMPISFIIRHNY